MAAAVLLALSALACAQDYIPPREACIENFGYLGCDAEGTPIPPKRIIPGSWFIGPRWRLPGGDEGRFFAWSNSEAEADDAALALCRRNAPTGCKLLTWAPNGCVGLAVQSMAVTSDTAPPTTAKRRLPSR